MLEKRFHVEIRTPQRLIYEGEVLSVRAPGILSSFEILAGHIPFLTVFDIGEIRIRESDTPQSIATSGGVFEVLRTGVTVLADTAEWTYELDVERAEAARQRAIERLASRDSEIDQMRAEAALARAANRIKIASQ
ncbi:MAG: ATP synthase F1 subunit epsilon [Candidatus Poribacteria bacterium]|nr:ATP synthase F1 subunit epsilon [Candidatus Poribacteria bacterium]